MALHEMYAAVTAKRPELIVSHKDDDGATWRITGFDAEMGLWVYRSEIGQTFLGKDSAPATIRSHWHDQLPDRHQLVRSGSDWSVKEGVIYFGWHGSAIAALGHFYLEHA